MSKVTVFVVHHGYRDYLKSVLYHARSNENFTVLIGSEPTLAKFCDEYINDDINLPRFEAFAKNYLHMSSNPSSYELLCFKRYYLLLQIAEYKNIYSFWMIDSDVLLLNSLFSFTHSHLLVNNFDLALSTRTQKYLEFDTSPHTSFWTIHALREFIEFLDNFYTGTVKHLIFEKYDHHKKNNLPGGICDMTALFLWKDSTKLKIFNTAKSHLLGLPFFDHNINLSRNFKEIEFNLAPKLRIKKLIRIKNSPDNKSSYKLQISSISGKLFPVISLHFQGGSKKYLPLFEKTYSIHTFSYVDYQFYKYIGKIKLFINRLMGKTYGH